MAPAVAFDDRGRGEPVVLVHAFPLDRRMWQPVVAELSTARFITPDIRGFGAAPLGAPWSVDDAADDLAALLDRLHLPRATLGGLSMGGYIAMAFARRHPDRLAGLILADTRMGADTAEARAGRDRAIAQIADRGVHSYVEEFVPKLAVTAKAREYALAIATLQTPTAIAAALAALRDRPDAAEGLAVLRVPVLVMVGAKDELTPPAEAQKITAAVPGAQYVEIPEAGHLACLDAPGAFAHAIKNFMRSCG